MKRRWGSIGTRAGRGAGSIGAPTSPKCGSFPYKQPLHGSYMVVIHFFNFLARHAKICQIPFVLYSIGYSIMWLNGVRTMDNIYRNNSYLIICSSYFFADHGSGRIAWPSMPILWRKKWVRNASARVGSRKDELEPFSCCRCHYAPSLITVLLKSRQIGFLLLE